ncbi:hypothetical protein [Burkholderia territorii]|uniref:hypothetical protein n=1 Tax=Burkholderia territorii TaxID=1503055 RepID=UPI0012DA3B90|nr:hypothetical protein [Burkholderia territorii]
MDHVMERARSVHDTANLEIHLLSGVSGARVAISNGQISLHQHAPKAGSPAYSFIIQESAMRSDIISRIFSIKFD